MKLFDRKVEDAIAEGLVHDETGIGATRNELQIPVLLDAIEHHKFDVCIGGARRDEEKARAKERFFLIVMILVNGTQKINDQKFGIYTTERKIKENISVCFQ